MADELTLGAALAIVGALLVVVLVVHGGWRLRRLREQRAVDARAAAAAARIEPTLGDGAAGGVGDGIDDEPAALRATPRRVPRIDALIDAIVPLTLDAPIAGAAVLAHQPGSRRAGSKPLYVEGRDAATGRWEPIAADGRYDELQAGVQLANRSGALGEIEYSEFVQKVQAMADAIGAHADFPDMLDVAARAKELDALTSPLDAQLTVRLRARGAAWSWPYLQQVAHRQGFVAGAVPGRLVVAGAEEGDPPVLVLAIDAQAALADEPLANAVDECALSLDVAQTPAAAEPYPAWHRAATQLADDLDATLVDDGGRPVTLHAWATIGAELDTLYRRLEALDLAAGSAAARRLFS